MSDSRALYLCSLGDICRQATRQIARYEAQVGIWIGNNVCEALKGLASIVRIVHPEECWDRRDPKNIMLRCHRGVLTLMIKDYMSDQFIFKSLGCRRRNRRRSGWKPGWGLQEGRLLTFWTHSQRVRTPFEAYRNLAPEVTRLTTLPILKSCLSQKG